MVLVIVEYILICVCCGLSWFVTTVGRLIIKMEFFNKYKDLFGVPQVSLENTSGVGCAFIEVAA